MIIADSNGTIRTVFPKRPCAKTHSRARQPLPNQHSDLLAIQPHDRPPLGSQPRSRQKER